MPHDIRILIVDDEESMRDFLRLMLTKEGYNITTAASGEEAVKILEENIFDLIVSDMQLGGKLNGVDILKTAKKLSHETVVLMITAYATLETAIETFREGAYDYVMKPFDVNEIKIKIKKALENRELELEVIRLRRELEEKFRYKNIVGKDEKMLKIFDLIEKVSQTEATVLLTGESGTGKDMVARAIHYSSFCKDGPFVSINCPAIPEALLESELFGHMKGSFTGAVQNKKGLFEQADGGTLFLDEIAELPLQMQVKLLNVLQEKKFRRVGGTQEIESNFRLICATNRDIPTMIEQNLFREDLWYRINVIQIEMIPLRMRRGDIPLLIQHFITNLAERSKSRITEVDKEALSLLVNYDWPGNVRELENVIERALTLETENIITKGSLPEKIVTQSSSAQETSQIQLTEEGLDLRKYIDDETRRIILEALEMTNGTHTKAAKLLKMPVRSLRYMLDKYEIK